MSLYSQESRNRRIGQVNGLMSPYVQRVRLSSIRKWLTGKRVLDFGCGTGKCVEYLPPGIDYLGVDRNAVALQSARQAYPNHSFLELPNLEAVENLGCFDVMIMAAVIEHLPDPGKVMRALSERLHAGGRLIVTTPHPWAGPLLTLGAHLTLLSQEAHEEHEVLLSREALMKLGSLVGLECLSYKRFLFGLNQIMVYEKPPVSN